MTGSALHESVVRMGRDIVRQFAHRERDDAVEEISAHILRFWDPRMRDELRDSMAHGDAEIEPILAEAVRTWPDEEEAQADRREPSGG